MSEPETHHQIRTIPDLLSHMAGLEDRSVLLYDRRGRESVSTSWADIYRLGCGAGQSLLEAGLQPGNHVFLQLPDTIDLITGFLGALTVGVVPCCVAPPRALGGLDLFRARMQRLLERFPRSRLMTTPEIGDATGISFLPPPTGRAADIPPSRDVDPEAIAFIQLTSGSTSLPKAVGISHRALAANVRNICASGECCREDTAVSWLPFYHDMGLVGNLFGAPRAGTDLHLIQPETFMARPQTWLKIISDQPGPVISTAPNFAFQHCVQRISTDAVAELDLSRWRIAGCGAERVRASTLDAFAAHFAPAGFRPESFTPCYGIAENTLAVTWGAGKKVPRVHDGNVSCGAPIPETEVVIRDLQDHPLPDGAQGEVTVRSPSLCSGYVFGDGERGGTDAVRTDGEQTGDEVQQDDDSARGTRIRDGWLYTGDRGYLHEGELYITGRLKDLIIIDGVNIDPDEIEAVAEDRVGVMGGRSGAFSVEVDQRERVVLVVESGKEDEATFADRNREIGDGVARMFGFKLFDLVFVRRGSICKTSSGKVQRSLLQERYEQNELENLWQQRDREIRAKDA